MKQKILFCSFFLMLFTAIGWAQEKIVKGTVSSDELPLPGAAVVVKGTTHGTQTDFDGNYTLTVKEGDILVFSFVGYTTQEKKVTGGGKNLTVNIKLKEETNTLDEVVVTGYSVQTRKTLATSVSKLDTKVLESAPRSNAATALQGSIAGLRVTQVTGKPGTTPEIQLRGGTGFDGSGSPLVLIDGVPGSFYALNSDDIESMEVLKDAASTAIYGARAANGVILVTTKKGKTGRSNITLRTKYTMNQKRSLPDYLNARDFIYWNRRAIKNVQDYGVHNFDQFLTGTHAMATGNNTTDSPYTTMELTNANRYLLNNPEWQTMTDPLDPNKTLIFQNNNVGELIYQYSDAKDYSVSFEGGNDKGSYYLGLGYLDDTGLVLGSNFKRYSGTFNGSYKITDDFKVSSNILYAQSNRVGSFRDALSGYANEDDYFIFQRFAGQAPTSRIYNTNPDGSSSKNYNPGSNSGFGNPAYYKDKFLMDNIEHRITASIQFDWKLLKNLSLMARASHFAIHDTSEKFYKSYLNSGALVSSRYASTAYGRTMNNQGTLTLNYKNTFAEKHNLSALLGGEYFKQQQFSSSAATEGSPTDLIRTLNAGSKASGIPSSYKRDYSIVSTFGQLNYDYDDRYLLGLTFRYDGTSKLRDNKFGFFPGASIGWNAHNEEFFKEGKVSQVVTRLKPRVSYGVNGNIDALTIYNDYYWLLGKYSVQSPYNGKKGYVNTDVPLYYLKWEKATTLNFGLDLGLLNNRVNFLVDYFIRDIYDKLADQRIPISTGFSSVKINNGTLQNRGIEIEANFKVINTDNIKWNIGANFTRIRSFVKKLPNNGNDKNRIGGEEIWDPSDPTKTMYVGGRQEGERVGDDLVLGYQDEGVYHNQAELEADKDRKIQFYAGIIPAANRKPMVGDTRWKDVNGDGIIDSRDRVVLGRTTPDFIGGFTTDFTYKNINLFIKTDYAVGHLVHNSVRSRGISQVQGNMNWTSEIRDTWTPENPNANIPRYDFTDPRGNHKAQTKAGEEQFTASSRYWEKGDYLALREITLSYNLPGAAVNNAFKDIRLFVSGTNLAYFTKYTGYSPEKGGWDNGRFPLPRSFTFGINATF